MSSSLNLYLHPLVPESSRCFLLPDQKTKKEFLTSYGNFLSAKCALAPRNTSIPKLNGGVSSLHFSRRELVSSSLISSLFLFAFPFAYLNDSSGAHAAPTVESSENSPEISYRTIRLKDVKDQKLQFALRSAVAGDLDTADDLFSELIAETPDSASLWSNRGSVRLSLERFRDAKEDFSRAIELAPYAPVPLLNRAIANEALGLLEEAASDCASAIKNDPKESAAWFNLGNVEMQMRDYDFALNAYERAADLSPGVAGYRLRQANILFQLGRSDESERLVSSIIRKYPNYAEAHASLAAMKWVNRQENSAEEELFSALQEFPNLKSMDFVKSNLMWPPALLDAYQKLLSLS